MLAREEAEDARCATIHDIDIGLSGQLRLADLKSLLNLAFAGLEVG